MQQGFAVIHGTPGRIVIDGLLADPPGVEQVRLIEQFHPLGEKLPVFGVFYFERGKVQNDLVRFTLPEIGDQGHIQRIGLIDAVFQVHSGSIGEPAGLRGNLVVTGCKRVQFQP